MTKRYLQAVRSAPEKLFVKIYKTKTGLLKNKYKINPASKVIKFIRHI